MLNSYFFKQNKTAAIPSAKSAFAKSVKALLLLAVFGITVSNAQTSTDCGDPGINPGDTGCVTFTYMNETKTYVTVRASDGTIWLKQNLGSESVATALNDAPSYGDLFQWGRWADGHQLRTSEIQAVPSPNNPAGATAVNTGFYSGSTAWWAEKQLTDTWTAPTPEEVTAVDGCDPCKALGAGWKMPSQADWTAVVEAENMTNAATAFESHLALPGAGNRSTSNTLTNVGTKGYYWSSTTSSTGGKYLFTSTLANPGSGGFRGQGSSVRCIKMIPAYCSTAFTDGCEQLNISDVTTSGGAINISNTNSGCAASGNGYNDFTAQSLTASRNSTIGFNVVYSAETAYLRVWIDWNQNKEFEDDEQVYISDAAEATQNTSFSVDLPENAVLGTTRIRIKAVSGVADFTSCSANAIGETEDYSITVTEDILGTGNFDKAKVNLYPNPTAGLFHINTSGNISQVTVHNMLGQQVWNGNSADINLSGMTDGIYLVRVQLDNNQVITQKMIKK